MKPPAQVNVVVDFDALIGRHRPGTDRAYIAGLGPVPVSAVREILDDAFLVAAVMQGTEVAKIKRLGRHVPLELRDALRIRDRFRCTTPGCTNWARLEMDHTIPYAQGGETSYAQPRPPLRHLPQAEDQQRPPLLGQRVTTDAERAVASGPWHRERDRQGGSVPSCRSRPWPETKSRPIPDPRQSDVDEWGRCEHMRELARRLYDPIYRHWFRVEWEGLEHIPTDGGALLVANHAGAIPSDAPVIMHGIETELGRPGLRPGRRPLQARCRSSARCGRASAACVAHPDNAYRLLREQQQLALVFPEGTKGTGQDLRRALPAAPLRPRRLRRDRDAGRRADRPDRGGRRRGVDADPLQERPASPSCSASPTCPITANMLAARARSALVALLPGQVQAPGARPGALRRPARPGALLAQPDHGRVRAHPAADPGSALRHAPHAPQSVWFG